MVAELLKFTANNALKSNKRLEKKKSKSLARKKKKATAIIVLTTGLLKLETMM